MKYFFLTILNTVLLSQTLQISEVVSSNSSIFFDEDGDTPDWIEIYNPSSSPVNLKDYGLSDDLSKKSKSKFPDISIKEDDYLLVLASDKNRVDMVSTWDGEVTSGDIWKYWPGISEPPSDWNSINFASANWNEGPSGFGYGDNDDNTILSQIISVYVRKTFTIENLEEVRTMHRSNFF